MNEVTDLFKDGSDELPPITGNQTNDDLDRLFYILGNLLKAAKFPGGTNAKVLITTKANYKVVHAGVTFDCLDMSLKAYDPSILSDVKTTDYMLS